MQEIFGEPSWRIESSRVQLFITRRGGHIGPVTFRLSGKRIQPFQIAPWHGEKVAGVPNILAVLRGDFFCLPFGGNSTAFLGERHPPHGETANSSWRCITACDGHVHLRLKTKVRRATVDKHLWLRPGHCAVYQQHVISGMSGPMNFGHHAMLRFPDRERSGLISTSGFAFGQVRPTVFEQPAKGGYQSLRPGATFRSLRRVPSLDGRCADLSSYPARRGFEDLVMLVNSCGSEFAWTAVTFPADGYVWFALKDPRILPHTLLWHSNGGRHYPPWNSRHVNVLGLEEVVSYFDEGIVASARPNHLSKRGVPTVHRFSPSRPCTVNYVVAIAPVPKGFDHVKSIKPATDGTGVVLRSKSGRHTHAPLDVKFLSRPATC